MKTTTLIFDFDGTLAASLDEAMAIYNRLAVERGYRAIDPSDIPELRALPLREAVRHLGVPITRVPGLWNRIRKELRTAIPGIRPIDGIPDAIHRLHDAGLILAVVSSNSVENIETFLRNNELTLFEAVAATGLFGKHRTLVSMMKQLGVMAGEVVYIGDEARDITCARKAGVRCASVCWGLNAKEALEKREPDLLFETPAALAEHFAPPTD